MKTPDAHGAYKVMTLLLVHGNTQYARSMFRISTWRLYHFCTIACYGTVTIIFLIVIANMEYHIIVLFARDFAFQILNVSAEFSSSCLCWVNCSLCFFAWVWFKLHWSWRICSSLTGRSRLRRESLTWTRNLELVLGLFDWELGLGTWTWTHISVEVVIFLQLPNSY